MTLWTAAYDHGLAERMPRRRLIRQLPEDAEPPEAWTLSECERIFVVASRVPGRVGTIPAGQFWLSLMLTAYFTGCRIGALMKAKTEDYRSGEGLTVRHQKNHRSQWVLIPPGCLRRHRFDVPGKSCIAMAVAARHPAFLPKGPADASRSPAFRVRRHTASYSTGLDEHASRTAPPSIRQLHSGKRDIPATRSRSSITSTRNWPKAKQPPTCCRSLVLWSRCPSRFLHCRHPPLSSRQARARAPRDAWRCGRLFMED